MVQLICLECCDKQSLSCCVKVAEKESQKRGSPLRVKKLFVLAALLIEQYHQHMRSSQKEKTKKRRPEVIDCSVVVSYVFILSRFIAYSECLLNNFGGIYGEVFAWILPLCTCTTVVIHHLLWMLGNFQRLK